MVKRFWVVIPLLLAVATVVWPFTVYALQSNNYRLDEGAIGTGNMLQSQSTSYQARDGVNDLAIGNSASSSFQIEAGSKTTPDPWLSFIVSSPSISFGVFSPTATATGTAQFSVLNYTSFGYVVQITGGSLKNGGHTIAPMDITGTAQTGIEQFGINLVANTSPVSLGANPNNGQFGFGSVAPNYASANHYRFVDGEIIAQAVKSSGQTDYTISYIVNVQPLTPGGRYTASQSLIVLGTY